MMMQLEEIGLWLESFMESKSMITCTAGSGDSISNFNPSSDNTVKSSLELCSMDILSNCPTNTGSSTSVSRSNSILVESNVIRQPVTAASSPPASFAVLLQSLLSEGEMCTGSSNSVDYQLPKLCLSSMLSDSTVDENFLDAISSSLHAIEQHSFFDVCNISGSNSAETAYVPWQQDIQYGNILHSDYSSGVSEYYTTVPECMYYMSCDEYYSQNFSDVLSAVGSFPSEAAAVADCYYKGCPEEAIQQHADFLHQYYYSAITLAPTSSDVSLPTTVSEVTNVPLEKIRAEAEKDFQCWKESKKLMRRLSRQGSWDLNKTTDFKKSSSETQRIIRQRHTTVDGQARH